MQGAAGMLRYRLEVFVVSTELMSSVFGGGQVEHRGGMDKATKKHVLSLLKNTGAGFAICVLLTWRKRSYVLRLRVTEMGCRGAEIGVALAVAMGCAILRWGMQEEGTERI
eukprot:270328-Rhodomonas_salina.1